MLNLQKEFYFYDTTTFTSRDFIIKELQDRFYKKDISWLVLYTESLSINNNHLYLFEKITDIFKNYNLIPTYRHLYKMLKNSPKFEEIVKNCYSVYQNNPEIFGNVQILIFENYQKMQNKYINYGDTTVIYEYFVKMQEGNYSFYRDKIFKYFYPLLLNIAARKSNMANFDELVQVGSIALLKAIDNFDIDKKDYMYNFFNKSINMYFNRYLSKNENNPSLNNLSLSIDTFEDDIIDSCLSIDMKKLLNTLSVEDAKFIKMYFGIGGLAKSMNDLAKIYNISKTSVYNRYQKIIKKLRQSEGKKYVIDYYEDDAHIVNEFLDNIDTIKAFFNYLNLAEREIITIAFGKNFNSINHRFIKAKKVEILKIFKKINRLAHLPHNTSRLYDVLWLDDAKYIKVLELIQNNYLLYSIFSKVFKKKLNGYENTLDLTPDEMIAYKELVISINTDVDSFISLYEVVSLPKYEVVPTNLVNMHYKIAANLLPEEYRRVVMLRLGLYNGFIYPYYAISEMLNIDLKVVIQLFNEGMVIYQSVLEDYNHKYGTKLERRI